MRHVSFRPVKGSVGIRLMYPLDTSSDRDVGALLMVERELPNLTAEDQKSLSKRSFFPQLLPVRASDIAPQHCEEQKNSKCHVHVSYTHWKERSR